MTQQTTGWKLSRVPRRRATTQVMGVTGLTLSIDDKWRIIDFELRDVKSASFDTDKGSMCATLGISRDVLNDLARYNEKECELHVQMNALVTRRFIWLQHVSAETVEAVIPRGTLVLGTTTPRCYVVAKKTTTNIHGKVLPGAPADGILYYIDALRGPLLPRLLQLVNMRLPLWRLSWAKY